MKRQPTRACVAKLKNLRDGGTSPEFEEKPGDLIEDSVSPSGLGAGVLDDEFQEPIPMEGIPDALKQQMVAVAPVLAGRYGVYDARFFTVVVGLCPRGIQVDQVIGQTPVTDDEILMKWKTRSDPYRFPVSLCVDNEQVTQFLEHHRLVYGGQPCNDSFSLRFLRACFATFAHKIEIDWVAEAMKRRSQRMDQRKHNRHKLGPVAIREQLATLCSVIHSFTANASDHKSCRNRSSKHKGSTAVATAECKLRKLVKMRDEAGAAHDSLLEDLRDSKEQLTICGQDEEELNKKYETLMATATVMGRECTNAVSKQKLVEGRDMLERLIKMSETREKAEASIRNIERDTLALSIKAYEYCKTAVAEAEEKIWKLKSTSLVLRPRAPFVYPTGNSVPTMWRTEPKICACCSKQGFVARAVIIASCGCEFHPTCIAQLLADHKHKCPHCEQKFHGAWMAQFGYPLTSRMEKDVANMKTRLEAEAASKLANKAVLAEGVVQNDGEDVVMGETTALHTSAGLFPEMSLEARAEQALEMTPIVPSLSSGAMRWAISVNSPGGANLSLFPGGASSSQYNPSESPSTSVAPRPCEFNVSFGQGGEISINRTPSTCD